MDEILPNLSSVWQKLGVYYDNIKDEDEEKLN